MVQRKHSITNQKKPNPTELPVYPFSADIPSIPERRFLFGIYKFTKIGVISLLVSILICTFLIFKAYSLYIAPTFIKWNDSQKRFVIVNTISGEKSAELSKKLTESTYILEYFIREYIKNTFDVSTSLVKNEERWCDATINTKNKSTDIFNTEKNCFLSNFSIPAVYSSFASNQKPAFQLMAKNGITRNTIILNMEKIYDMKTQPDDSFFMKFLPQPEIKISSLYQIDFILKDNIPNSQPKYTVMTAFITVGGLEKNPRLKTTENISYLFNPNYNTILNNYLINPNMDKQIEIK